MIVTENSSPDNTKGEEEQDIVKDVPQVQLDLGEVSPLSYDQEHMGETRTNVQHTKVKANSNWVRNLNFLNISVSREATKDDQSVEMAPTHLVGGGLDPLDMAGPVHGANENVDIAERESLAEDDGLGILSRTDSEAEKSPVSESQEIRAQVTEPAAHKIATINSDADIRNGQKVEGIISS
jgi:hypothetical protein